MMRFRPVQVVIVLSLLLNRASTAALDSLSQPVQHQTRGTEKSNIISYPDAVAASNRKETSSGGGIHHERSLLSRSEASVFFTEDFEGANVLNSWELTGTPDGPRWNLRTTSDQYGMAYSGSKAIWFGDPVAGQYGGNCFPTDPPCSVYSGTLTYSGTPISIPSNFPYVRMAFQSYELTEKSFPWGCAAGDTGTPFCAFDLRQVWISGTNDSNWQLQWSTNQDPITEGLWRPVVIDLSEYKGTSVRLRFTFNTNDPYYNPGDDGANKPAGWFVDYIRLFTEKGIDVPVDIVLLQDETGSMTDDIDALRSLAPQIWDSVAGISAAEFRMGVAGFRDYAQNAWGNTGDWVYRRVGDFTTSREQFVANVNLLTASGGDDEPEAQYEALDYLLTASHPCIDSDDNGNCADPWDTPTGQQPNFRSGARRIILLATDAPFHDPDDTLGYPGPRRDTVVNALNTNRAIVIGLVPGGVGVIPEVDDLAALTGGSTQDTGSSGQDIANAIVAALGELRPVSPDLSTIQVDPSSVPADGTIPVTITVTLRDTAGAPVAGKTVFLFSNRGDDVISQPLIPTDANGQTTGIIRSLTAGISTIMALDVTDNVQLDQQVDVEFTGLTIPPIDELQRCIDLLDRLSRSELDHLKDTSIVAGQDADYFLSKTGEDAAKGIYDSIWAFVNVIVPGSNQIAAAAGWKLPGFLSPDWGAARYLKNVHPDAGNFFHLELWESIKGGGFHIYPARAWMDGLMYYAAEIANSSIEELTTAGARAAWEHVFSTRAWSQAVDRFVADTDSVQSAILEQHDAIVSGIPPMTDDEQRVFATDLCGRSTVPITLGDIIKNQGDLAHNLRLAHDSVGGGGVGLFLLKFLGSNMAYVMWDGPGKILFDGITSSLDLYLDTRQLEAAQRGFTGALSFFQGAPEVVRELYSNAYHGFDRVRRNMSPRPLTGEIQDVRHYSQGVNWIIVWQERSSYSDIDIKNTSGERATFAAKVKYGYNSTLFGLPWAYIPLVTEGTLTLDPGQSGTVRVYYKREEKGGSPDDGSWIQVHVLASNDTGIFKVSYYGSFWEPLKVSASGALMASDALAAHVPTIENPIYTYVFGNPDNQTYEGQIWVVNPFTNTITANITQSLPAGVSIVATDGTVNGSAITWQHAVAASDIVSMTFTFQYPATPGVPLSLPAAEMSFIEPVSGQLLATQSNIPSFRGLWPVTVHGYVPLTTFGIRATMPITISNLLSQTVGGSITVVISNTAGAQVYGNTQPFGVSGLSSSTLVFTLPGAMPPGLYLIEAWLAVDGATQRFLGDVYEIRGSKVFLPIIRK